MAERMQSSIEVANPDDITVALTITMKLGDWKRLKAQLGTSWPNWELAGVITKAVDRLDGRIRGEEVSG